MTTTENETPDTAEAKALATKLRATAAELEDSARTGKASDVLRDVRRTLPAHLVTPAAGGPPSASKPKTMAEVVAGSLASSERRMSGAEVPAPVPWPHFAEALQGGLWPGVHVIVSGTGAGKSTLSTDIALCAAQKGHRVGYVSLELDADQIGHRFIGALTRTWWSDLTTGKQGLGGQEKAREAGAKLAQLPIFVQTAGANGWHASGLKELWASMSEGLPSKGAATPTKPHRTPVIVVDYLQLVSGPPGESLPIRERVGQAAYEAHRLSIEFGAAVVLVSSIARTHYPLVGENNDKRHEHFVHINRRADPTNETRYLHDLVNSDALVGLGKEAGEVEFSATTVTTMVKVPYSPGDGNGKYRVLTLAKNRFGETSWTGLYLSEGTFTEAKPESQKEIANRLAVDSRKQQTAKRVNGKSDNEYLD